MEIVVAVDKNWAIGRGTELLVAISADLKRFRELTLGKTMVYGRKTMESFPGGKPLPKRRNIILSRTLEEGEGYDVCRSFSELQLKIQDCTDLCLIGGASVYTALEPFCTSAEITCIDYAFADAEHFIPDFDKLEHWSLVHESERMYDETHALYFTYRRYENRAPKALSGIGKLDTDAGQ